MAERYRTIIREEAFEDELRVLIPDVESADEFVMAAEILLARDPEIGSHAPNSDIWLLPMSPVGKSAVYLYYSFDADCVYFVAFRRAD